MMKRLVLAIAALLCTMICQAQNKNNRDYVQNAQNAGNEKNIEMNITAKWDKMYAWMWNTKQIYDERFIPLYKKNDSTWTLSISIDPDKIKNAGVLFVDENSWNINYHKTNDMPLRTACYEIPEHFENKELILTKDGVKVLVFSHKCEKIDCE